MKSASEDFIVPPPGRYESEIVGATPGVGKKSGVERIELQVEIKNPPEYTGCMAYDYIITDGGAKGGGMGKKKLRGLGVNVDATDDEIPNEQICDFLLGRRLWVQFGNEQQMGKDARGEYTVPETRTDPKTGHQVPMMKLTIKEYFQHNVGGTAHQAPQQFAQQAAPQLQGPPQLPPQFAPQQVAQAPQQLPQQPQFAQPPVQPQLAQPQLPPQFAQPQQQAWQGQPQLPLQGQPLPVGAVAQGQPVQQLPANPVAVVPQSNGAGAMAPGAVPPWVAAQAGGAPVAEEGGGKRGRKAGK